jgi:OTU-like cysteine protease
MSCLFNSLSYFIPQTDPQAIRARICDYLQANSPIIDGMATHDVLQLDSLTTSDQYIGAMRTLTTWGGAIEIQAACAIWNARIVVHDIRSSHGNGHGPKQTIEFLPVANDANDANDAINSPDKTFTLEWSGGHYEPVRH